MNDFKTLMKLFLVTSYTPRRKNNKKKSVSLYTPIIVCFCVMLALSLMYNFLYFFMFKDLGVPHMYPEMIIGLTMIITLMTTIFRAQMILFNKRDHEMLTPLPISKRSIVGTKLSLFYIEELVYSIIFLLPTVILYSTIETWFILYGILAIILVPIIPMLFSSLVGFVVSAISARFKYAKSISAILLVVVYFGFIFMMSNGSEEAMSGMFSRIFIIKWAIKAFVEFDMLYVLLLFAIGAFGSGILISLYTLGYDKIYELLNRTASKKVYSSNNVKTSGYIKSQLKIEFKRLVSMPMALLNACVPTMMIVIVLGSMFGAVRDIDLATMREGLSPFALIGALILGLLSGITTYSSFSISMENKTVWLIKSAPIRLKDYIMVKLIVSHIFAGIVPFIISIVAGVMFRLNVWMFIGLVVLTQLMILTIELISMLFNLKYPKLNWTSFNEIKNSTSILLSMLVGIAYPLLLIFAGVMAGLKLSEAWMNSIVTGIVVLGFIGAVLLFKLKARKLFEEI